jgi:hypothetical protein
VGYVLYRNVTGELTNASPTPICAGQRRPSTFSATVVSKGNGTSEHRLENRDGDELAGFCVHLRAKRTRRRTAVQTPELLRDSGLRVLPLGGFPSLPIGVFWRGRISEIAQVFVDELAGRAKRIFGKPEEKV